MAEKVLTTASSVQCPHGFKITFTSSAIVRVDGKTVVRASDLASAVLACTSQAKCTLIATPLPTSTTLREGATDPVVLARGLTTNIGPCTLLDAAHDLLRTD